MIIHIMTSSIYTERYIKLISKNEDLGSHVFYVSGRQINYGGAAVPNVQNLSSIASIKNLLISASNANGILLHQLNQPRIMMLLLIFRPSIIKKLGWVIWGGDLSFFLASKKTLKTKVIGILYSWIISRLAMIVAHIPGDYKLLSKNYRLKAVYLCAKYPGSTKKIDLVERGGIAKRKLSIMVGNSGDHSNRHVDVFDYLRRFSKENLEIHTVLSYGQNQDYINSVVDAGELRFKEKFVPHLNFMPYENYLDLLSTIDICVFYHDRQQGMGNLNMFFGLGAKVYLSEKVTTYDYYTSLGMEVFPTEDIPNISFESFKCMDRKVKENNSFLIASDMDPNTIKAGWSEVFRYFNAHY